jgi:hypothetical protein
MQKNRLALEGLSGETFSPITWQQRPHSKVFDLRLQQNNPKRSLDHSCLWLDHIKIEARYLRHYTPIGHIQTRSPAFLTATDQSIKQL